DQFSLSGTIDATTTISVSLVASFGEDPLSSENLPTTSADWGDGVGAQWTVSEIFIDRGFDRLSSGISTLEVASSVPETGGPHVVFGLPAFLLLVYHHRRTRLTRTL